MHTGQIYLEQTCPLIQYPALLFGFNCNIHYCWCNVTNTLLLVPSLVKWHVCWFSTTLLNTCDVKDVDMMSWWHYMDAVQWNFNRYACELGTFNQTCLLVYWKSKRKATWPMPLQYTCQLTLWNFISQDCYIHAVSRVVMSLQLQHICLLA